MSKTHELKIYPKYFEAILDGKRHSKSEKITGISTLETALF
jgi:hypothetical protein